MKYLFCRPCSSTGTVPILLRPVTGVHRILLNKEEEQRIFSLLTLLSLAPDSPLRGQSVAPVLRPFKWKSGSLYSVVKNPNKGKHSDF